MLRSADALFLGSHKNKIDKKNRIAIPAEFRKAIDTDRFNGFVCVPSLSGPYLDCGGLDLLVRFQKMLEQLDPFDPDREDLEIAIMGRARKLSFDGDGRVVLPTPLKEHAGVIDHACFVGRGALFQIWNVDHVEERFAKAQARAQERRFVLKSTPLAQNISKEKA